MSKLLVVPDHPFNTGITEEGVSMMKVEITLEEYRFLIESHKDLIVTDEKMYKAKRELVDTLKEWKKWQYAAMPERYVQRLADLQKEMGIPEEQESEEDE